MAVVSKRSTQRAVRFRSPESERAEAMLASLGQLALLAVLWPVLLALKVLGWAEHVASVLLGVYFGLVQVCVFDGRTEGQRGGSGLALDALTAGPPLQPPPLQPPPPAAPQSHSQTPFHRCLCVSTSAGGRICRRRHRTPAAEPRGAEPPGVGSRCGRGQA